MNNQSINTVRQLIRQHKFIIREKEFCINIPPKDYGTTSETDILIEELNYCIGQLHDLANADNKLKDAINQDKKIQGC